MKMPGKKGPFTTAGYLEAYSTGQIGSRQTMRGIGVDGFRGLLDAMLEHGDPLPRGRGREEETAREVRQALPLIAEAMGVEIPESPRLDDGRTPSCRDDGFPSVSP